MPQPAPSCGRTARAPFFLALFVGLILVRQAWAQGPYAPETFNVDKCIPPISNAKYYRSDPGQNQLRAAHQRWHQNVFRKPVHKKFQNCQQPPPRSGAFSIQTIHDFISEIDGEFSMDGGISFVPATAPAHGIVSVLFNHFTGDVDYYDNEMLTLDVSGLPFGMKIRESPTLASVGVTTIRPVPGGYMISSFFDVFTELSPDGGTTWIPSLDSLGMPLAGHVALDDVQTTSVDPEPIQRQFLYVPNPLQRGGPIRFAVGRPGPVRLQVFDLLGRLVATLADDEMAPGERTFIWDGTDLRGRSLNRGMYLFRLTTQDGRETARAVYTH